MKKLIILFILFSNGVLAGVIPQNEVLSIIESGQVNYLSNHNIEEFNEINITGKLSEKEITGKIAKTKSVIIIQNKTITGSLNINSKNCKLEKLVFLNCLFTGQMVVEEASVTEHLAFVGCKFNKGIQVVDFSTKCLTFAANQLENDFAFVCPKKDNNIVDFYFIQNSLAKLSIQALNLMYGNYLGELTFKKVVLINNYIKNVLFSGISPQILFIANNIINNIKVDGIKSGCLISIQYNYIKFCQISYLTETEKDGLFFSGNSIEEFRMLNNSMNKCIISSNKLENTYIRVLHCNWVFGLINNLYSDNSKIDFGDCDINKFNFENYTDSIICIALDTLLNLEEYKKQQKENKRVFRINEPEGTYYTMLNYKKLKNDNKKYTINFNDTPIHEKNWFIDFENIKKVDGFYRIATKDTVISKIHEAYSTIQNAYANQGKWNQADACFLEWKEFERLNYRKLTKEPFFREIAKTGFHYLNWLSCGYGIKPLRIFPFAFFVILFFAIIYFFMPEPIASLEKHLISQDKIKKKLRNMPSEKLKMLFSEDDFNFDIKKQSLIEDIISSIGTDELFDRLKMKPKSRYNLNFFWNCFYFSFSTFTTIGIGDFYPTGKLNKAIVMIQGALGWLCLGLFITTYANILLR